MLKSILRRLALQNHIRIAAGSRSVVFGFPSRITALAVKMAYPNRKDYIRLSFAGKRLTMAHDVFISYSSHDKLTADAACAALESRGIRCWIAPRDVFPGEEYAASLVRALHECRVMVLVFSSGANRSPQVLREVERAVSRGVPILPLRIEDVPPSEAMEYYISSRHWLDALTQPLEQHLIRLAETVKILLSRAEDDALSYRLEPAVKPVGTLRDIPQQTAEPPVPKSIPPLAPENFQPKPNASSAPTTKFASTTVILIALVAVLSIAVVLIVIHLHNSSATTATSAQQPVAPSTAQLSNPSQATPPSPSVDVNSQPVPASSPAPSSSPLPTPPTIVSSPSANTHKPAPSSLVSPMRAATSSATGTSPMQQYMKGVNYYDSGQYAQALTLFQQAAAQGNAPAENHLGLMYMNGFGVSTNYAQALSWYNKAAAQGNFSGECNLGIMYDRGLGVPRDKVTAYMWYIVATQDGSPLAPKNARLLAPQLTAQQLNEAQRRAAALKARQK
jgi:tetratricopeptide (TPR) repeat protein